MIICIGREFGSGGHEIGKIIAEKLGMELYDRDLIDKAAEKMLQCQRRSGKGGMRKNNESMASIRCGMMCRIRNSTE